MPYHLGIHKYQENNNLIEYTQRTNLLQYYDEKQITVLINIDYFFDNFLTRSVLICDRERGWRGDGATLR